MALLNNPHHIKRLKTRRRAASILTGLTISFAGVNAFALDWLSIGSAHPDDVRLLMNQSNGLQTVDWHMHPCNFKQCILPNTVNLLQYSDVSTIMQTRGAMTIESDQGAWNYDYDRAYLDKMVQYSGGKPIAMYAITLRTTGWTWDSPRWTECNGQLDQCAALPPVLLDKNNSLDVRAAYYHIPASANPTSSWTPYQQTPEFDWGSYLNINAGVMFDMPGHNYLTNDVPQSLQSIGFTGESWKNFIITMFNQESGIRTVILQMSGNYPADVNTTMTAMEKMLEDGMKIDRFVVENFTGYPYQGDFVGDYNKILNKFLALRNKYPSSP